MNLVPSRSAARWLRAATVAATLSTCGTAAWAQAADCLAAAIPVGAIDMRVLVVAADGQEPVYGAIRSTLDHLGVPYDTLLAASQPLTAEQLCGVSAGSGRGRYQAVILTTGNLSFLNPLTNAWESAFTSEEWQRLWQYEAKYRVRQATLYTYPGGLPESYGLSLVRATETSSAPIEARLTTTVPAGSTDPSGTQVFSYLNKAAPIRIRDAWTYLATPGTGVTPLLTTAEGHAIASIASYPDGRRNLTITTDGSPWLMHSAALGYGIVNWVTRGLFVGQGRVYMSAHPDDIMMANQMWDPVARTDESGKIYRITARDYNRFADWQARLQSTVRNAAGIRMEQPFNGLGASADYPVEELYPATVDDLTPAIRARHAPFTWISHTYTHLNLDAPVTYAQTLSELRQNAKTATSLGFTGSNWARDALVTPQISGLNNPEAMRAMRDFGVRWIVSDTSKFCGHRNQAQVDTQGCPRPNTGVYHDLQPEILMVPRYPTNLYYNVCTPQEWTSEYNHMYRTFWGRDLTLAEIIDKESDLWLRYMVNFDMRPVMFHQPNLCAYDGTRSLLGDLVEATMAKYNAIYDLPVRSRQVRQIGKLMADRMAREKAMAAASPLRVSIVPGTGNASIVLTNPTASPVIVPLTGVNWTGTAGAPVREAYGGQTTTQVTVPANGGTLTLTGVPAW